MLDFSEYSIFDESELFGDGVLGYNGSTPNLEELEKFNKSMEEVNRDYRSKLRNKSNNDITYEKTDTTS